MNSTTIPNPRACQDVELVSLAIGGSQQAFQTLMERYQSSIYHMMLKMVKNQEDADDLTIEAFGKAFHKLPSYTPRFAFSTWLYRIAINNCIDHIRKKKLQLLSIDEPVEHDGDKDYSYNLRADNLNPEETYIRNQKLTLIRQVLQRLNPKYRLMIELRYFEELSYGEIAYELEIPLGTVKAQLFRAKEMLYNLLQKPGAKAYIDMRRRKRKPRRMAMAAAV